MTQTRTATLERTYPAHPEQIWRAWTDPDLLSRWHGCGPDQLWTVHEWDVRIGGSLRVSMDIDGEVVVVEGAFIEVEQPSRLRYTFGEGITIAVTIESTADGSRVIVQHAGLPTDEIHGIVTDGWTNSLGQLAALESLSSR